MTPTESHSPASVRAAAEAASESLALTGLLVVGAATIAALVVFLPLRLAELYRPATPLLLAYFALLAAAAFSPIPYAYLRVQSIRLPKLRARQSATRRACLLAAACLVGLAAFSLYAAILVVSAIPLGPGERDAALLLVCIPAAVFGAPALAFTRHWLRWGIEPETPRARSGLALLVLMAHSATIAWLSFLLLRTVH